MHKSKEIYFLICIFFTFILASSPALGETCKPTPQMSMGTHHKPITQHKTNIGQGLNVKGTVLSAKNCAPIENARIEHWQTNSEGEYVDELRAYLMSDNNGQFQFETEWPTSPVPHIHFIIIAEGYKKLVTQWIALEKVDAVDLEFVIEPLPK